MATRDLGLLVLRLGAGGILMVHGYPKLFGGPDKEVSPAVTSILGPDFPETVKKGGKEAFANALRSMDVPEPEIAALASGLAEFGGGLALALGAATGPAGLAAAANMAVASYKVHGKQGLASQGGYEFSALLGLCALALAMTGPGAFSIDHLFGKA
ncbi:MAG: DoxX family protein [Chloroflexia bacterium]|nr:DoxX family protein [Chloroflexia bacterium]